jgi:hypothetical protein
MEQVYKKQKLYDFDDSDELLEQLNEFSSNQSTSISDGGEEEWNEDWEEELNEDEMNQIIVNTMNNNNCVCYDPNCSGCDISKKEDKKFILDYWREGDGYEGGYYLGEIQGNDVYYHPYLVFPETYDVIGVFDAASGDVYNGLKTLSKYIPVSEEIAEHILKQGMELELWQKIDSE